jgi:hypothetical protein
MVIMVPHIFQIRMEGSILFCHNIFHYLPLGTFLCDGIPKMVRQSSTSEHDMHIHTHTCCINLLRIKIYAWVIIACPHHEYGSNFKLSLSLYSINEQNTKCLQWGYISDLCFMTYCKQEFLHVFYCNNIVQFILKRLLKSKILFKN